MKSLRQLFTRSASSSPSDASAEAAVHAAVEEETTTHSAFTPKKGKPTPRRRDVERARGINRGPITPAPKTRKEARQREKSQYAGMTKQEIKEAKAREREESRRIQEYRRQRMMAGDEDYLLPRDRGEVRRYLRDWVDGQYTPLSWFMPIVLILLLGTLFPVPRLQVAVTYIAIGLCALLLVESARMMIMGSWVARKKFPTHTEGNIRPGWYALMRATQLRRWRQPAPQVTPSFRSPRKDAED